MQMIQTKLERPTPEGVLEQVAFLPYDRRVRVGSVISVNKGGIRWRVTAQYGREDSRNLRTDWKVGGLQ